MSVPLTLLGLLDRQPRHGYDLKRDYDAFFGRDKPLPFGQVYATLGRLARDGKVAAGASEPGDGPGKFAPLVVLYSSELAATEIAVRLEGGGVVVPTFDFPGGRRFHFSDGVGNVLGVWSE